MAKQTGSEYREKNRIRLQRFYDRQAASGKKRVSALVADEAYRLLTDQKEQSGESMSTLIDQAVMVAYGEQGIPDIMSDEAYALLMDAKEHTGESMPMLIDRAVRAAFGYLDIPDVDDVSEDFLAAYGGPDPADTPADDTPDPAQVAPPSAVKVDDPGDQIPDCTGQEITLEQRDRIMVQVMDLLPGRNNAQARVDELNRKGIPVSLKPGQYGGTWDRKKFTDNFLHAKKRLGIK